jgi:hypothetical protein
LDSRAAAYDFVGTREEALAAGAPKLGQFASSYYVFTLLENIATTGGICLHGGVPRWTIDGDAVRQAFVNLGLWTAPLPEELPFFRRAHSADFARDIQDYFFRMLGPMHALQSAYPFIDVSHFIKSFEAQADREPGERPETLERGIASAEAVKPVNIVVVYDSQDPDAEPAVWVPRRVAPYWSSLPLNKSQELGGRYPNTDPADITLLEAGANAAFPDYVQLP